MSIQRVLPFMQSNSPLVVAAHEPLNHYLSAESTLSYSLNLEWSITHNQQQNWVQRPRQWSPPLCKNKAWASGSYILNHFADNCCNINNPARFSKCSGQLKVENCRQKFLKCLNCVKAKIICSKDHAATSRLCPILIKERNQLQRRTSYCHETN